MEIIDEAIEGEVVERRFDLRVDDQVVPGIHWMPQGLDEPRPTVCIGHGGYQHKRVENVLELARQLVTHLGVAVVALDAPGHGDRVDPAAAERARADLARQRAAGGRPSIDPEAMAALERRAQRHVGEWRALVDDLQADLRWSGGPFGWWGVSMGTRHGLPVVAGDRRFTAAVFGLYALRPGDDALAALAASITVPVLFLNQSDDELMTRDAALALWDAFGSEEKTVHVNPGGHVQVPRFERDSSEAFFRRHLLART